MMEKLVKLIYKSLFLQINRKDQSISLTSVFLVPS